MNDYLAFGLHVRSSFPIPEFVPGPSTGEPDVRIETAAVRHPSRRLSRRDSGIVNTEDGTFLHWPGVAKFHVRHGTTIRVDPAPKSDPEILRLPLLGVVFGILLHQRGLFTLHASTVAVHDSGVAFLGWKGAGKSTLAAALFSLGHRLITDDVLALDLTHEDESSIEVVPGFPQIKLFPHASSALGGGEHDLELLHPTMQKKALRPHESFDTRRVPLSRIYVLEDGEEIERIALKKKDSLIQLLTHSYAARFLGSDGAGPEHLRQCRRLAQNVPMFRLVRPRNLALLDRLGRFVADDLG